jgi:hypothetical protein
MACSKFSPYLFFNHSLPVHTLLILFVLLFFCSCKEDPEAIGFEVIPGTDLINAKDTLVAVEAYTLEGDSIYSTNRAKSPFGSYIDPVFGGFKAGFITEFVPASTVTFASGTVVDSLVFRMYFNLAKKDYYLTEPSNKLPLMKVYKLTEQLVDSAYYYSNLNPADITSPVPVSVSEPYLGDTSLSVVYIRLSKEYGNELLNIPDSVYSNNDYLVSEFKKYVFGLYVESEMNDADRSIPYFGLTQDSTYLTLYYHNDTDTLFFDYAIYPNQDKRVNLFSFDHSKSSIHRLNDTLVQDTAVYLQSLGGTYIYMKMPCLEQLKADLGKVSINKAELVLPVETDDVTGDYYFKPAQLGLHYLDGSGTTHLLPDDPARAGSNATNYFGGRYDEDLKAYVFNISNFVHEYFSGDITAVGLRVYAAELITYTSYSTTYTNIEFNAVGAERVVLTSGINSNPIKLRMYYTAVE